ncbi:transglycosylase SLT domain-containing protein [Streptomyces sp. NPDC048521]|uniref:transglycosylase SLT domain-containing protein n=1 Tax=Streptomyces sp. NPDC048521 TaxID=3365566 RepID=UPI0037209EEF
MAISVGSVEVDVVPNAQGVRQRLQQQLVPAANEVGDEVGRVIGRYLTSHVARSFVQGIQNGGRQAQPAAARQGQSTGSTFARSFRARLEAALASLPEVRLRADSSDAEREIYQIRAQMRALADARIGIDVSTETANAAIARLQERLQRLSASDADVAVRVDAGAASAQLAAFQAEVNRLDGQSVDVDVDTHSAAANFNLLTTAALAFGPAILPVLPVVAAGLGAIAAAGVAAAAGVGAVGLVALPAFKQMATVMQAQKAAQDAATSATARGGQAASQAAQRSLQLASAQQALATARRNAARQIADAERGVSDAVRQAAAANAQAAQQVKAARQSLADAYDQAADRMRQANAQVGSAERDLAQAQKASRQAQLDLTAARKEAAQQLEDLNNRLTDSQLSQRDAEIALTEATAARDAVLKNAKSSELDKQKALLVYDQAVQRLKEQTSETRRLKEETAAANKAGVDGSTTVKDAQDRLAQSQQEVTDKTAALKAAQDNVTKTQVSNSRAIADAQGKLAEAQKNVAETQRQGAETIARAQERVVQTQQSSADAVTSAQRQIESASLSAAGGVDQAAIAQSKYQEELAKLTPSARDTFNAFTDLKGAFGAWSKSLQPTVMPIFTKALIGLKNALPGLTPFVTEAADAIKGLQDRFSQQIKTPFWQGFKKDLQGSVKPAITGLGVAFGNVITGMAGIIDAFLPHMDGISGHLQSITGKFAAWGKGLKGSPEFERFLSYSSEHAPLIADTLGKIAGAFLAIGTALQPVSGPLLQVIGGTAQAIGWLATNVPGLVPAIYGLFVATRLWALWQLILNGAMTAFNLVMALGPWGWIALAIAGVVLAVLALWEHCAGFRDAVKVIWANIQAGGQAVIDWFTGPFVDFFTKTIPNTFQTVLTWVKKNWPWILGALSGPIGLAVVYIIKHWDAITSGISDAWTAIKKNTLYPIRDFFTKTVPGWADTLRDGIVDSFAEAAKGVKKGFDKVKGYAKTPVQYVVDVVYNDGIRRVWNLVTDAFGGKHLDPLKFETGGILPGYTPGRDVHLAALSGGEAVMRPEWTRAVGPGYVHTMNAAARAGGVSGVQRALGLPAFKDGGIFDGIGDVLSSGWDKIKKGASWLKDTFGSAVRAGVNHVVNPLINAIPGGNVGFVGLLKNLMKGAVAKLIGAGKEGDKRSTPNVKYSPSKGVEQWRGVVQQALRQVGQPLSYTNITLRRMQQESGGNPTIVNKWDSNWQAGHPSVGLMQVIRGTFQHYAGKYRRKGPFLYGVSVDPLANVYASMKYALGAYRSLPRAYNRAGGYDSGGWMPPGMNLMYNGLGQPEAVLTPQQWSAIQGAAVRGSDGTSGPSHFEGDLYLDSGEFLGRVRGEAQQVVAQNNQQIMTALGARPRG